VDLSIFQEKAKMNERWLTLREVASYMKISYYHAARIWPSWENMGVKAYRPGGKKILFDIRQIDKMIQTSALN